MATALGVGLLLGIELALRVLNVAPDGQPPEEIFRKPPALFVRDGSRVRTNPKQVLITGQSFGVQKSPDVFRVFIVGGSAAMGFPLEGNYGLSQLLKIGLDAAEPGHSHEVINAAGFGFASRDVLRAVKAIVAYQPDLIVVWTGDNEYLRRRYLPADAPGVSRPVKLLARLRLLRTLQGMLALVQKTEAKWEPHLVSDLERKLIEAEYRRNLEAMIAAAKPSGASVILMTSPVNLEDFRPYGPSIISATAQRAVCEQIGNGAPAQLQQRDPAEVMKILMGDWSEPANNDAWVRYMQGVIWREKARAAGSGSPQLQSSPMLDAFRQFALAAEFDPMPVRAPAPINAIIQDLTKQKNALLADASDYFDFLRIVQGASDSDLFFDHCHPRPRGQREIAAVMLQAVIENDLIKSDEDWSERTTAAWQELEKALPPKVLADACYKVAYESGVNMDRVHRGYDLAREALKLDPEHQKARLLLERLEPQAKQRYRLIGD